jgi:hypothetical protein
VQIGQHTPKIVEAAERSAQSEPQIDGLLACVARLRQVLEGCQGLLEIAHGLAMGRRCHGLLPRLPRVRHGLVPDLAPQGVMRQAFGLLAQPLSCERLKGLDDVGMQCSPPLLEQRLVGDLLGERMFEGVFDLGEEARLIQELGGLQMREA